MRKGIGGHQSANMKTDEWLSPPEIIAALGQFDLDPCSPIDRPWDTAVKHYTVLDNGLDQEWEGRVWMNPPYGTECTKWMGKLATHGNGISLIFARTETAMFFQHVWPKADSVFFFEGRLFFHLVDAPNKERCLTHPHEWYLYNEELESKAMACKHCGVSKANGGAPSCLISYGEHNADAIAHSGLKGKHLPLNAPPLIVIGVSPSWKSVVSIVVKKLDGQATVKAITELVETIAPDKVQQNKHYREQIRKVLQQHFERKDRGVYSNNN